MEAIAKAQGFSGVVGWFTSIGLKLIPLMGAIAFLAFVWGVAKFIRSAGSDKEVKESKNFLVWGVVGMVVLSAIWGIITFLSKEFGFGDSIALPLIKF